MQRLTARLLLLFALAGMLAPLALQATAAPIRACCRRMGAHRCMDSTSSDAPVVRGTGCCNHSCCHAVTTPQWATANAAHRHIPAQNVTTREVDSRPIVPSRELLSPQSTRAPPTC